MTARPYNGFEFVETVALKTRRPIMMIQTEGMGASSTRYQDITGVPEATRAELCDTGLAFVTFDSVDEAGDAFETLMTNWPEEGRTTLGITVYLGVPGQRTRIFDAIPGNERSFRLAA